MRREDGVESTSLQLWFKVMWVRPIAPTTPCATVSGACWPKSRVNEPLAESVWVNVVVGVFDIVGVFVGVLVLVGVLVVTLRVLGVAVALLVGMFVLGVVDLGTDVGVLMVGIDDLGTVVGVLVVEPVDVGACDGINVVVGVSVRVRGLVGTLVVGECVVVGTVVGANV